MASPQSAHGRQWFISDLHLSRERPGTQALLERFLAEFPDDGDRLYILGDLFDAWIGDDDDAELARDVREGIHGAVARGVRVFVQRGNRDVFLGRRFGRDTGALMLPDEFVVPVAGQATLLLHGDQLCTDDIDYQRARRRLHNPLYRWFLLRKPLAERRALARDFRQRSREAKAGKCEEIMDANDATVLRYLRRHNVAHMIHGHTHRPATHSHRLPDGCEATRLVLPEWHGDIAEAWVDDGIALRSRRIEPA